MTIISGEPIIEIYESFDSSYWFITEKCHKQDSLISGMAYKDQILFGYVRLAACPECAEWGYISETECACQADIGPRSSRQGRNPAGESPVVPVARFRHVAMPHLGMGNHPGDAWCKWPGRPGHIKARWWVQPECLANMGT